MRYIVLAYDMYGRGVVGDRERVMATLMDLRDVPDRLAQRAAGLAALTARAEVNGWLAAGFASAPSIECSLRRWA